MQAAMLVLELDGAEEALSVSQAIGTAQVATISYLHLALLADAVAQPNPLMKWRRWHLPYRRVEQSVVTWEPALVPVVVAGRPRRTTDQLVGRLVLLSKQQGWGGGQTRSQQGFGGGGGQTRKDGDRLVYFFRHELCLSYSYPMLIT